MGKANRKRALAIIFSSSTSSPSKLIQPHLKNPIWSRICPPPNWPPGIGKYTNKWPDHYLFDCFWRIIFPSSTNRNIKNFFKSYHPFKWSILLAREMLWWYNS